MENRFDRFLERLDPRLTWLLALLCLTPLALAPFYIFFLVLSPLVGMSVWEVTVMFLNESLLALDPLFALCIGSWLMFSYFYSVLVPPAQEIERRGVSAQLGIHAFRVRLAAVCLTLRVFAIGGSLAPLRILARRLACLLSEIISYARLAACHEPPRHLAVGWSPGTHPQVVYH